MAGGVTLLSIIICIITIKCSFFSNNKVNVEADDDDIEELEQRWQYKNKIGVDIVKYENKDN